MLFRSAVKKALTIFLRAKPRTVRLTLPSCWVRGRPAASLALSEGTEAVHGGKGNLLNAMAGDARSCSDSCCVLTGIGATLV